MFTTLISAQELSAQITQTNTVLLDCRHDLMDACSGQNAYQQGHLPNARFVHLDRQLSGPKKSSDQMFSGRHPLPSEEDFIQCLRSLGVNDDTQVIVYDAHGGMFAARLWWMLRWVGHQAVAVLDGGLPAWVAQGLPLSTALPEVSPGTISRKPSLVTYVNVDQVLDNLSTQQRLVVDARSPDRYRGENETMDPVGGHIPGAKNRFFKDNLQADGRFKSPEQLRDEWQAFVPDVNHANRAIMQCGSGVTACHNLLALEVAGLSGAALYPGSWSEWCASPARPVALG
ncbi:sulfurtransferase [Undibacterium piscinae]|uniref:Sulfurtransferase n=1 Tax=Undibacterium piscinae TaxID=2495591 RepID=A0A6M4A6Q5_9BURK|nr:sulfurtransferase [Undibacterium piscinae]